MKRGKIITLASSAALIFAFVSISSNVQALPNLGETIAELHDSESFREAGGIPPSEEMSREAGEWQNEAAELARERELAFEEFLEPPDPDGEGANESLEELREGPLGGGGGGDCGGGGWCPPSCMSCDPPAY